MGKVSEKPIREVKVTYEGGDVAIFPNVEGSHKVVRNYPAGHIPGSGDADTWFDNYIWFMERK